MQNEKAAISAHGRIHKEAPIGREPSTAYTLHAVPKHDRMHDQLVNETNELKSAPEEKGDWAAGDLTKTPGDQKNVVGVVEKVWEDRIEGGDRK
ncbi:hypothetical protein HDU87_003050 [Geranomyces variabilis]|uniref:Uncharacterized protein n=1 Tax=Geranomyces variabilis TaxID=109894 RepID=A0AAD5TQG5_9FUNG|nr:hypothetical protein HDU87_003050 [Geranomyces variabilis]